MKIYLPIPNYYSLSNVGAYLPIQKVVDELVTKATSILS